MKIGKSKSSKYLAPVNKLESKTSSRHQNLNSKQDDTFTNTSQLSSTMQNLRSNSRSSFVTRKKTLKTNLNNSSYLKSSKLSQYSRRQSPRSSHLLGDKSRNSKSPMKKEIGSVEVGVLDEKRVEVVEYITNICQTIQAIAKEVPS